MKGLFSFSLLCICINVTIQAQFKTDTTGLFTVTKYDKYLSQLFIGKIDTNRYQITKSFRNNMAFLDLMVNDQKKDSIPIDNTYLTYWPSLKVHITGKFDVNKEERVKIYADLETGKFHELKITDHLFCEQDGIAYGGTFVPSNYPLGIAEYIPTLVQYNLQTGDQKTLYEFENNPETGNGIIQVLTSKSGNLLVEIAECYMPLEQCENYSYYRYNLKNDELIELSDLKFDEPYFVKRDIDGIHHYYERANEHNYKNRRKGIFVLNGEFEISGYSLEGKRNYNMIGWNYQDGKLHSYNFKSTLDEEKYKMGKTLKEVIIPYKLTHVLETSLYNIYHNQEIDKGRFKEFGLYELLILKNMIFAKHNYAFSKPFYQAYFNLFDFYNDEKMRASRTKDMNGLLTEVDNKNLVAINKALKQYD
jgi:hypothetical protein